MFAYSTALAIIRLWKDGPTVTSYPAPEQKQNEAKTLGSRISAEI